MTLNEIFDYAIKGIVTEKSALINMRNNAVAHQDDEFANWLTDKINTLYAKIDAIDEIRADLEL